MAENHKCKYIGLFFNKVYDRICFGGHEAENITFSHFHERFPSVRTFDLVQHFLKSHRAGIRLDRRSHQRQVERIYHFLGPHSHLTGLFTRSAKNPIGRPPPTSSPQSFRSANSSPVPSTSHARPPSPSPARPISPFAVSDLGIDSSDSSEINVPVRRKKRRTSLEMLTDPWWLLAKR